MIQIDDLQKSFDGNHILRGLTLHAAEGEKVAIIGPSGCGKSTLLRLMMGLHKPDSGDIVIDDIDISTLNNDGIRQLRRKFGMLFQSAALFDSMNVEENIKFPMLENDGYSQEDMKRKVKETLEMVEMEGRETAMPADLSGGQRKRIGLARAIAADPKIILYDEPTTGLDPILSTNIENLIVKLSDHLKVTSIIVTHQVSTILRTADNIYLLEDGKLLEPETPDTIYEAKNHYGTFIRGGIET